MAPWWSRPTADTAEDDADQDESPASDRDTGGDGASGKSTRRSGRTRSGRSSPSTPKSTPKKSPRDRPDDEPPPPEEARDAQKRSRSRGNGNRRSRSGRSGAASDAGGRARRAPKPKAGGGNGRAAAQPAVHDTEKIKPGENVTVPMRDTEDREIPREIVITVPERATAAEPERKLAMLCDLENVALGAKDSGTTFNIEMVLERLVEKGKIIVKKAYADWQRYSDYKRPFHEAGIELIDIPQKYYSGKNSADIKMVVDAIDLCYAKEHLDTFVVVSGDSDFTPLVSKLKENDKHVIGVGVKNSSSNLLVDNCDEFIYYEDIWRDTEAAPKLDSLSKKEKEVFGLLSDSILALQRENKDVLWGSMIKQTMQRKRPSFNEGYYGYSTFSDLLEDAESKSVVKLKKDQRSGSYIVTGFSRRKR